ncbi:DeoR/GlpR family DNA-binding transcription regulator [Vibrio genomosp. F10]|uniref:Glycerol-3-phosphate regulon repressor n=2 Tax=Vibrio genomosp. F10 TaxID=723171 RepID=A0A1B9R0H6_9VIBR|nr:DeoR/GlpR family DNA-binding transcription regulator [Vibrio genomosp. F10]OCH77679.1 glycerol-3-phosphate regulon repressor [Vibrio genomosp. F10]OEE34468.1 glycerol-3-phosphate regulon repressor [Vibrio genomosp. F10 str. ZF-129]OEE98604.1 glycerol-3-phosphate regulon repressor [Vibrio genomosp. F10 str. 9ZC157]OEF06317.1 glycerol-3-phosphate regulon repressor [Vibrio genomosp. F10 str. 9ZB36]
MELTDRQQQILSYLKQHSDVQIGALASMFAVTTQTIRRDVNLLCEQGLARRVHGGLSLPAILTNTTYQFRREVESDIKRSIAKEVARQIPEGSTIIMGIGTSVTYVAEFLIGFQALRVVTNNLQVARILEANPNIEVYLTGGRVRCEHQDLIGHSVLAFFDDFEADIGIVGCGSITPNLSAMEHELPEAEISKAILSNCRQNWLLADASKWGRFASVKVAGLSSFSRIYTNKAGLPSDLPIYSVE